MPTSPPPHHAPSTCDKVSFTMTIESYSEAKNLCSDEVIESDPAVNAGGHSWRMAFDPNGYHADAGTSASAYMFLFLQLDDDGRGRTADADEDVHVTFKFMMHEAEGGRVVFSSDKVAATFNRRRNAHGFERFVSRDEFDKSPLFGSYRFTIQCHLTVFVATDEPSKALPSGLHADLGRLLETKQGADVELEVGGEVLAAHKSVLAARSPVFMERFFGEIKEEDTSYVRILDVCPVAFQALLHYMYTDALPEMAMNVVQVEELLVAAERYKLKHLKVVAENRMCNRIGEPTVLVLLELAERYQCCKLKRMCLQFLRFSSNTKAIMATDKVEELATSSPSLVKDVIVAILDGREARERRTRCIGIGILALCFIFSFFSWWFVYLLH